MIKFVSNKNAKITFKNNGITFFFMKPCYYAPDCIEELEPHFLYDKNYIEALKTNTSDILDIFEWCNQSKDFEEVRSCHTLAKWFYNSLETWMDQPRQDSDEYKEYFSFLKNVQYNKFIDGKSKEIVIRFISNEENFPKEPKQIKPPTLPIKGHIYLVEALGLYKIGKEKNKTSRTNHFHTIMPVEVKLIHSFCSNDYSNAEKILHKKYSHLRQKGEWFSLSNEEVNEICSIQDYQL